MLFRLRSILLSCCLYAFTMRGQKTFWLLPALSGHSQEQQSDSAQSQALEWQLLFAGDQTNVDEGVAE